MGGREVKGLVVGRVGGDEVMAAWGRVGTQGPGEWLVVESVWS